jgi:hypothetical protein
MQSRGERGDVARTLELGSVARRLAFEVVRATEELLAEATTGASSSPSRTFPSKPKSKASRGR